MEALAWFGNKDARVIGVPIPDMTEPDDIIVSKRQALPSDVVQILL